METKDLLLSSEERYEIWEVKRAERPNLLMLEKDAGDIDDINDDDNNSTTDDPLPLLDGCDIAGWRNSKSVFVSNYLQGYLNVGSGCVLTRKDTQLPILSSRSLRRWKELQQQLLQSPPSERAPRRIVGKEASTLSQYPWFERDNVPVVLEGLTDSWKAMDTCQFDRLVETFGDYDWRFSDTHGATTTLRTYRKYVHSLEGQTDDAPLAVYDSELYTDERESLLRDYQVPTCFDAPDLFECLDDEERPPYRWILIGPARSGTGLHIDPLGTHAWVTLLEGAKRWVLFPYGTDKSVMGMQDPQIPSALWFSSKWYRDSIQQVPRAIEVLQLPGETVYVPAGWPHLVLNLEFSTAITHNYATEHPSWRRIQDAVKDEEPDLYVEWEKRLRPIRPDLFEGRHTVAVLMDNVTDNNVTPAAVTPSNCTALLLQLQGDEQSQKQSLSSPLNVLPYSEPIPGLFLFENILTREEEIPILRLLDLEDVIPWKTSRFNGISYGKRWGVHCNLRDRRVDAPQHPLPKEIQHFIQTKLSLVKETLKGRCNNAQFLDFQPNEANAIDYRRKEGHWLQAHVDDRQLSKEPIANLSLAGDCIMTFRLQNRRSVSQQQQQQPFNNNYPEEHRVLLKRGTLQVLTGKARYDYSHGIANTDLLSDRRVSITMRESPLTLAPSSSKKPPRTSSVAVVTVNNNVIISSPKPLPHFAWRNYQPPPKQQQPPTTTTTTNTTTTGNDGLTKRANSNNPYVKQKTKLDTE
ncbi:transcription factor jumonji [Nitzschia inconspicua]|uniref:Transcription factor jumonji n=1 Tax=Nitzschia inconspicua TaxID=303405 RepID=A0A9K3PRB0_9STRA|nr:transcription factor jumonji [Nitzschia inconspicua]